MLQILNCLGHNPVQTGIYRIYSRYTVGQQPGCYRFYRGHVCTIPCTQEDMFHADSLKLFEAIQGTADQLRSMVREACPDIAVKLSEADVDFSPMIVQNWMVDIFINVLPTDAAARVWGHIILDNVPGLPLKFSLKLLLSSRKQILKSLPEDLNEVLTRIPSRIQSSKDVDWLLEMDLTTDPVQNSEIAEITVAMVLPWLLVPGQTAVHQPHARGPARPPVFPKPCLKGHIQFVGYCL